MAITLRREKEAVIVNALEKRNRETTSTKHLATHSPNSNLKSKSSLTIKRQASWATAIIAGFLQALTDAINVVSSWFRQITTTPQSVTLARKLDAIRRQRQSIQKRATEVSQRLRARIASRTSDIARRLSTIDDIHKQQVNTMKVAQFEEEHIDRTLSPRMATLRKQAQFKIDAEIEGLKNEKESLEVHDKQLGIHEDQLVATQMQLTI